MNVLIRATSALVAMAWSLCAAAADAPASASASASAPASASASAPASASASASAPASAAPAPARCAAPGTDRAANQACAGALARHAEAERAAGRNDAALAAFARADEFAPEDLRFLMARASISLKLANQMTPAGVDAAARAAPDDLGLAMLHAELSLAKKDYATSLADIDRVLAKRPQAGMAWEMRATVDVARPDFAATRADVARSLQLDPKSPGSLRLRGIVRNNAGDYAGALADYEAGHAIAPRPDDPFVIGSTQFLQHRFAEAAATLARHAPPAPEGTYWTVWRYLALARLTGVERASGALGPGAAPGQAVAWPVPVIDYLHGTLDAKALLDFAQKSQDARDLSQVCEAHFYMAEDALLRQRGDAIALFRQALAECPQNFHEYEGAAAELRAAGVPLQSSRPMVAATAGAPAASTAPTPAASAPAP
jgi:lipoprotein NlpI